MGQLGIGLLSIPLIIIDWTITTLGPFLSTAGFAVAIVTGLLAFASQLSAGISTPALLGSGRWYGRVAGWFVLVAGTAFSALLIGVTLILVVASSLVSQGVSSYTSPFSW